MTMSFCTRGNNVEAAVLTLYPVWGITTFEPVVRAYDIVITVLDYAYDCAHVTRPHVLWLWSVRGI